MFNFIFVVFLSIFITGCSFTSNIKNNQSSLVTGSLSESDKQAISVTSKLMLNTKYTYGGKKPDFGVDCSGFVSYVFNTSINYKITGAAKDMAKIGNTISKNHAFENKLVIGDLLFFNTTGASYSHVGIYIGNNKFIHASSGQKRVVISDTNTEYYKKRLELVKRL